MNRKTEGGKDFCLVPASLDEPLLQESNLHLDVFNTLTASLHGLNELRVFARLRDERLEEPLRLTEVADRPLVGVVEGEASSFRSFGAKRGRPGLGRHAG